MSLLVALWIGLAQAGAVYVNGIRADVLPEVEMKNVTVRVDADGNIWIDAPQYKVTAVPTSSAAAAPSQASPGPMGLPAGQWWLVTEDQGSVGQVLDVHVNGVRVFRAISSQTSALLDIGPWLRKGNNEVRIEPQGAAPSAGGALHVWVGHGANVGGTVQIDTASVHYSRSAAEPMGSRTFVVYVP